MRDRLGGEERKGGGRDRARWTAEGQRGRQSTEIERKSNDTNIECVHPPLRLRVMRSKSKWARGRGQQSGRRGREGRKQGRGKEGQGGEEQDGMRSRQRETHRMRAGELETVMQSKYFAIKLLLDLVCMCIICILHTH